VSSAYLTPEDKARRKIDLQLEAAGWIVQSRNEVNVAAGLGVAVRDRRGMPDPDYLAAEIIEDLKAALAEFEELANQLDSEPDIDQVSS